MGGRFGSRTAGWGGVGKTTARKGGASTRAAVVMPAAKSTTAQRWSSEELSEESGCWDGQLPWAWAQVEAGGAA